MDGDGCIGECIVDRWMKDGWGERDGERFGQDYVSDIPAAPVAAHNPLCTCHSTARSGN